MNAINIGVDVGNFDTKTAHTLIGSGYLTYSMLPQMSQNHIKYKGVYYIQTQNRFPYVMDKTSNEQCFILTLFGIAKEIIFKLSRGKDINQEQLQSSISKYKNFNLGAGLPPLHCNALSEKTKKYYLRHFDKEVEFEYNHYIFKLNLKNCFIFPQDFAAIHDNPKCKFIKDYEKYYAIDIGGYTVDVITIVSGMPDMNICASKDLGILKMYSQIINKIMLQTGLTIDNSNIESVLFNKRHVLSQEIIDIVNITAKEWAEKILNELRELGIEYRAYPCVFIGGGSLLLKKYINKSPIIGAHEYIVDIHANARGYERLLNACIPKE